MTRSLRLTFALLFEYLFFIMTGGMIISASDMAQAQHGKSAVIRDTEIERLMYDYAIPILKVADINVESVKIHILNSEKFNAFVPNGRRIFINSGTIIQSETPNETIGVIAHEAGHISGGHNIKLRSRLASTETAFLASILLGIGISALEPSAGIAVISGSQTALSRTLLSYQRSEESVADRSAIRYLSQTGQSSRGMIKVFRRLANNTFGTRTADPYTLSHPMAYKRLSRLQHLAKADKYFNRNDSPSLQERHDLARAKLRGFMDQPDTLNRHYPEQNRTLAARYARAISLYRNGSPDIALRKIDDLIAANPRNPYFHELKGQVLLENGRAREALAPLREALSLQPESDLIRLLYGQSLLAADHINEAIEALSQALDSEPDSARGWRQLAIAYGRKGDIPRAGMASAQSYFIAGDLERAKQHAARVQNKTERGSPLWLQADDILNYESNHKPNRIAPQAF